MSRRILVVEDDKDIRKNLKRLLESEDYLVQTAEHGQAALEVLASTPDAELPDVIVLDLMMPGVDGFQFREAQEKSARIAYIPIVVMSAGGNVEEKKIAMGAKAAIKKPADLDTILAAIRSISL
jgi:CheY-like chemotaxis protein